MTSLPSVRSSIRATPALFYPPVHGFAISRRLSPATVAVADPSACPARPLCRMIMYCA